MLRILIAAAFALTSVAAAKLESDHKPKFPAVTHAAKACTPDGAFGRDFTREGYGHIDSTADEDWAPFEHLTIAGKEITVEASFHDAGTGDEGDVALARKFRKAFEKAIEDDGKFPEHEKHGDGIEFRTKKDPDRGLVFQIRQNEDRVIATCIDLGD